MATWPLRVTRVSSLSSQTLTSPTVHQPHTRRHTQDPRLPSGAPPQKSVVFTSAAKVSRSRKSNPPLLDNGVEYGEKEARWEATVEVSQPRQVCRSPEANVILPPPSSAYIGVTQLTLCNSAANNATKSPLLLLPPEIRCRIYDDVFSGCILHVSSNNERGIGRRPKQTLHTKFCQSPQDCAAVPSLHRDQRKLQGISNPVPSPRDGPPSICVQTGSRSIPVQVLQASRQIYHEAVLKPFTETTFSFDISGLRSGSRGLYMFLESLVPEQLRAIARVCITSYGSRFLSPFLVSRFEGLKHVEVDVVLWSMQELPRSLRTFERQPGILELGERGLKSVRFTVVHIMEDSDDNAEKRFREWARHKEDEILSKQQSLLTAD